MNLNLSFETKELAQAARIEILAVKDWEADMISVSKSFLAGDWVLLDAWNKPL